jgi:hypothetical protein
MKSYTSHVIETEDGELAIELPVEMLNQMGWVEETVLEWLIEPEKVIIKEANNGGS